MEFFCYHRSRPGSDELRGELREAHWSYMDGFADELIARGPTALGSVHIVDVPDAAAAREFAFAEPCYQAGVFRDVLVRRWHNSLGRTMWQFPGDPEADELFVVLGLGSGPAVDLEPRSSESLFAYGPLWSDDGTAWLGTAALVQASNEEAARGLLTADRYDAIEVDFWAPGGRR
ncbi:YciI family protein [Amycolatopsis benzoatilytica]|uniref:YciI family protein n=1 Tax=Amycolatopsis benzoatilytica TaxID=346045 RepID=UPI000485A731|nr:YciI family protein [Amycolatopsis benzoatilytica]